MQLPKIPKGKRCLVMGRTGSGKTTGAAWLISRSPGPWVIVNPKYDDLLSSLGPSVDWSASSVLAGLKKSKRFVVVHPTDITVSGMDDPLLELCETGLPLSFCLDELLYWQKGNAQCGPGLMGLLTRGRSRGQSLIGTTQRPANISQYCYSEADYYACYCLKTKRDQQRIAEFTGRTDVGKERAPHQWGWYDVCEDRKSELGAVPFEGLQKRFL